MGAPEMVERIRADAREERERILRDARAKVEERVKNAKAEIEARKKQFIESEERKAAESKDRIIRAKKQSAKRLRWNAEEEMINRVLDGALKRVQQIKKEGFKGNSYPAILAGLIRDAALSIIAGGGTSELEVILSAEDAQFVTEEMLKGLAEELGGDVRLRVADERINTVGGVIVRRGDGRIEVNNTFEERMKRLSSGLREDIVRVLFHAS